MNRVCVVITAVLVAIAFSATSAAADKKKKPASASQAPASAKIAESMGDLRWGMSKADLERKFNTAVKAKYQPLIAKTKSAVEEDHLREQERDELAAISKGYVEFDGRTTGWDVSFLKGEFAHKTNESMLVVRDSNSQNFYFFIDGKFWKWYKAFDAAVFPADDFAAFEKAIERRFGPSRSVHAELRPGEAERQWLEWQDPKTRLRAIDETDFYGFYSLVFEQKATVDQLARLRQGADTGSTGPKKHTLVESVTTDPDSHSDSEADIADRISGRTPAPSQEGKPAESAKPSKSGTKNQTPPSAPKAKPAGDDDPLTGIGL
jgi:hypothetical protein